MIFRKIAPAILMAACSFCSDHPLSAKPASLQFIDCGFGRDGRKWLPSGYDIKPESGIVRYIPEGENLNRWTELVTMQWYENIGVTPLEYLKNFMQEIYNAFPNEQVSNLIIKKTNLSLAIEWWTEKADGGGPPLHYGLAKAFSIPPNLYLLTYVTHDTSKAFRAKSVWIPLFKEARLLYSALENEEP